MAVFRSVILTLCAAAALPCLGKEAIYLKSGFRLEANSHAEERQTIVLYTDTGTLELPSSEVDRVEILPDEPHAPQAAPSKKANSEKPFDILTNAADLQGLEPELVRSVARIESGLRQDAVSRKGALGLMQLMPGTAQELGVEPKVAQENAQGGAKYLRDLLSKYGGAYVLALAAYNAGPGAVAKYGGIPPYAETRRYIQNVLREYYRQKQATQSQSAAAR